MALDYYEGAELTLLRDFLLVDLSIIELGGSLGVVACRVNRRLKYPAQHWVIEANPDLIPVLQKNRLLNQCSFSVLLAALAY